MAVFARSARVSESRLRPTYREKIAAIRAPRHTRLRIEPLEERTLLNVGAGGDGATSSELTYHHVVYNAATGAPYVAPPSSFIGPLDIAPLGYSSPVGLTPQQVRGAYGVNSIMLGSITGDGSGQTVAIVDAYDNPKFVSSTDATFLDSDLHKFDVQFFDGQFGMPGHPTFTKLDQNGGTAYPTGNTGWGTEIALDVEWVHAMAPMANIILVEANDAYDSNLISVAVNTARNLPGVTAVSMSFGGGELSSDVGTGAIFTTPAGHSGVTFLASTGDTGSPGGFPAYSPNVVAVGGTNLTVSGNNYLSETGWSGSGGGQSLYESQPSYQSGVQSSGKRQIPDVAFDASTGVAVYDSYSQGSTAPWISVGGTSLSAPCWAGLVAVANQLRVAQGAAPLDGPSQTLPALYNLPAADFHDITSGSNGGFSAGAGYDMVTGRGTPVANLLVPALAPSDARIVFATTRNGSTNYEIYAMNADGTGQSRLTNNFVHDANPACSPDGTRIAYTSYPEGIDEIYIMNADGSGQTRLTNNMDHDTEPEFSHDGSKIVFDSTRDGNDEIYVMNADGTGPKRLTNNYSSEESPTFSPDGSKIAYVSDRGSGFGYNIYVMNVDGTGETRLTFDTEYDLTPSYSPDGSKILFSSNRDGNYEIYVMNADGTNPTRLTNNAAHDMYPAFSPDGTRIAFSSIRDGNYEIYVMNADGTNPTRVTNNSAIDNMPTWLRVGADTTPPTAITLSPTDNATGVALNANLVITFNENIQKGTTGNIIIRKAGNDSLVETIAVASSQVTISGAQATIDPSVTFTTNTSYYVQIDGGTFKDLAGNAYAGLTSPTAWNFTTTATTTFFAATMDTNPGWTTSGQWAFGHPTGGGGAVHGKPDPTNGFTGSNVYGVNLSGDYSTTVGGPYYLTTGTIDCTGYTGVTLQFERWLNSDYSSYVADTVDVSGDGGSIWTNVYQNSSMVSDSSWQLVQYNISAVADNKPSVKIRWGYQVKSGAYAYSGWNVDDVTLLGIANPAPVLTSLSPADNAANVAADSNLTITFDKNIQKGTAGNIVIRRASDNSVFETIPASSSQVTVSGNQATIDPWATFTESGSFCVQISSGAFTSLAGDPYAGINDSTTWNFTASNVTAPTTTLVASVDGYATDTGPNGTFDTLDTTGESILTRKLSGIDEDRGLLAFNIAGISPSAAIVSATLRFSVGMFTGASGAYPVFDIYGYADNGTLSLPDATAAATKIGTTTITDLGVKTVSLDPAFLQSLLGTTSHVGLRTQCPVLDGQWAMFDSIDELYDLPTDFPTLILTTIPDAQAPTVASLSPADNATGVGLNDNLVITFNEAVKKGTAGNIVIKKADNTTFETIPVTDSRVTISGSQVTINPTGTFSSNTGYYVQIDNGAIKDLAGNSYAGISSATAWNFTTGDFTPPTVSTLFPPADNATGVALNANLVITFSENIQKGASGNVVIKKSGDNSTVETIPVTSTQVTISGAQATIDPAETFAPNIGFYVQIDAGALKDLTGNACAGISDLTTWNFTTLPAGTLSVAVSPGSVAENAGANAAVGTVTRTGDLSQPLVVTLSSSDTSEATAPTTVSILANQSSANFRVDAVDDSILDGVQNVSITASAPGYVFIPTNPGDIGLDTMFGTAGYASVPLNQTYQDYYPDVVVQPDGKIVAVSGMGSGTPTSWKVVRTQANGALDTSFGTGGSVVTSFSGSTLTQAIGVAIQPDGKIVVLGRAGAGQLVRYLSDGSLDSSFGSGGISPIEFTTLDDVTVLVDGKILVAGSSGGALAVARFDGSGSLDATFGSNGVAKLSCWPDSFGEAYDMAIQPDGRIVLAGAAAQWSTSNNKFTVARLTADGLPDPTFGTDGWRWIDFGAKPAVAEAVALQDDGKIVLAGSVSANPSFPRLGGSPRQPRRLHRHELQRRWPRYPCCHSES